MAKRFEQSTGPTQRQQRVAELVRHALAEVLSRGDLQDDVLTKNVITIPEVRMSPDLKLATAYVMPLGGRDVDAVLKALDRNKKLLRQDVATDRHVLVQKPAVLIAAREPAAIPRTIDADAEADGIDFVTHHSRSSAAAGCSRTTTVISANGFRMRAPRPRPRAWKRFITMFLPTQASLTTRSLGSSW